VVYGRQEFVAKIAAGDRFVCELLTQPRLFLQGSEDDIGKLAGDKKIAGAGS
jgi:hypothetical protein